MRDFELYQAVLGLRAPWAVVNVELDVTRQQVTVTVEAGSGPHPCPACQEAVPGYDRKRRRWRHLDTCQFTTWIQADVPRVRCPTHGVKQITVPWAEAGSQFTAWFERLAIDLLRECSITGAAGLLRLTWDEAWGIKERAVARGLSRRTQEVVPHLGVDEKAIAKRHRYLTVVADLEQSRVLYLAEDRKQESLDSFWATLTPEQRDGIEAIAMDMWEPYIQSTRAHLEEADGKIVFDKFHVAKHLHDAVDHVRRAEHRALKQTNDTRLTGTKYLWLMRPREMTSAQRATFRTLQHTDLKVARAWALKERFRQFWDYTYWGAAQKFFDRWFWRATHSRLTPMAEVAKLIRRHLPNVLTYLQHRITNAGVEAINSTIQWVKKTARGFRNVEHFKTAIYFHCGGLDLYPHYFLKRQDFVQDRLELPWDEFNRVPVAGVTNTARLTDMLNTATLAFLVMTAEDERADGVVQARMNVVHEAGLFQGRLGFSKAIILLEDGCEQFSNIEGLGQIRFPSGNIAAAFEEVRRVLEREGLIQPPSIGGGSI